MGEHVSNEDRAYVDGVRWAQDVVRGSIIASGIRHGILTPGARGMTWADIAHQVDEVHGEGTADRLLAIALDAIPDAPLSGEWTDAPTAADIRARFGEDDDVDDWSVVDSWEAGATDVATMVWSLDATGADILAHLARTR